MMRATTRVTEAIGAYRQAARARQVETDELLRTLAVRCAAETKEGNIRPIGQRCRMCREHFIDGACTLGDKVKAGHD